ncbi:MAG: TSUP family transporter [Candidatus Thorarchaeota archaeon]
MLPVAVFFILIPIAIVTGIVAAVLGIGGGVLMVPILYYGIFSFVGDIVSDPIILTMSFATTISSTVIIFTGISGTIAFSLQKRVDFLVGGLSALFSVAGAILGKWVQYQIDNTALTIIFASLLIVTAGRMIFKVITNYQKKRKADKKLEVEECESSEKVEEDINKKELMKDDLAPVKKTIFARMTLTRDFEDNCKEKKQYSVKVYLTPLAFLGGFVAGIAGLGGGVVMVPILNIVMGLPIHFATATSAFIMIFSSISALVTAVISKPEVIPDIWWPFVAGLAVGIIIGAQIGALIAKRLKAEPLKAIFAVALTAVGIWSIVRALLGL